MTERNAENGAFPHEFPPTANHGIYWCRHCGLVTSRPHRVEPCPSRALLSERTDA